MPQAMQLCAQLYFWHGERETVRETDRQKERQIIYIKTDVQTHRQTDREGDRLPLLVKFVRERSE